MKKKNRKRKEEMNVNHHQILLTAVFAGESLKLNKEIEKERERNL